MSSGTDKPQWHFWPVSWGTLHMRGNCTKAFFENPVGFGEERMRTVTGERAAERMKRKVCGRCLYRYVQIMEGVPSDEWVE